MKRLLLVILCLLAFPVVASHIVGGEFEILHISGYRYKINLIIYFDEINGLQANKDQDQVINAKIFRVSDNAVMEENVSLFYTSISDVNYTKAECSVDELKTSRMYYTTEITMSPERYSDPKGYYIVWERCCRNYTIENIFSSSPDTGGLAAGQTFYLKFPPVTMDGQPFVNSSPRLFPPLSDYACLNQPYYADFTGTDDDGDSLVYKLVTPLSTHGQTAYPPILPQPYPLVTWRAPYNLENILNGSPDLQISADGLLTVTPKDVVGYFVFAVQCEEFRDGVKIGEVRRDFQMLVLDCKDADPPKISAKADGSSTYIEGDLSVSYSNTVSDEDRCVTVKVTDPDAFRTTDGQRENVSIRAIALGFKDDVSTVLPEIITSTLSPENPSTEFKICFDQCPLQEGPFQIGIISYDDACALPLADTVVLTINITAPTNDDPVLSPDVRETVLEGLEKSWAVLGTDADNDSLVVSVVTDDFDFNTTGFFFDTLQNEKGIFEARLRWDADCKEYDFTERTDFKIKIIIDDLDDCDANVPDSIVFNLHVALPQQNSPIISTNLSQERQHITVERKVFESLAFTVFGSDQDPDLLHLEMFTPEFTPSTYGIKFPPAQGVSAVSSRFDWKILCDQIDLEVKDEFEFLFVVRDPLDICKIYRSDSLTVSVKVLPAENTAPDLTVTNLTPDVKLVDGEYQMTMGQNINLNLVSKDNDADPIDHLFLQLIDATGNVEPSGYQFTSAEGDGTVQSPFTWTPDCSIFENGVYDNEYVFRFRTMDNRCENILADTVEVRMRIKDFDGSDTEFLPPNFITPNADGCNDFFGMEDVEGSSCGEMHIPKLPLDNCMGKFSSIHIYNRWGKEVFESSRRDFRWYANSEAAGVYFYTVFYTNNEYKGSVTVMY